MTEPVACSLTGAARADRAAWLAALRGQVIAVERHTTGLVARFPAPLAPQLRALADAEAQCCPFLRFEVTTSQDTSELRVEGPPDAQPVIDEFLPSMRTGG
jgi:MerR family copper efflux transcriptional regulator